MKNKVTDEILLESYKNGCNVSLSNLYLRYYPLFMKVSKKYLCNKEEAEDLIHSVMERLLCLSIENRIKRFDKINNVSSFFYTIIKNASLDLIRKKKLEIVNTDSIVNIIPNDESCDTKLALEYKHSGLTSMEILYFEEYLKGTKPRHIALKFSKSISTIKNTLNSSKKKIISNYKSNNYKFE